MRSNHRLGDYRISQHRSTRPTISESFLSSINLPVSCILDPSRNMDPSHLRWINCSSCPCGFQENGHETKEVLHLCSSQEGANVTIEALARRILRILYHLLMNQEIYEEPGVAKRTRPVRIDRSSSQRELIAQEMIDILGRSGYEVRMIDRGACE
jgi:hypothetical protein